MGQRLLCEFTGFFFFLDMKGTRLSYLEAYAVDQQTGMVKSIKLIENEYVYTFSFSLKIN